MLLEEKEIENERGGISKLTDRKISVKQRSRAEWFYLIQTRKKVPLGSFQAKLTWTEEKNVLIRQKCPVDNILNVFMDKFKFKKYKFDH